MLFSEYPGVYGIEHIIYLLSVLALMIAGIILIKKFVKSEQTLNLIVKISGIVLFIAIIANRISVTYSDVVISQRDGYTWLNLIPNSFCGLASLVLSIIILVGKKNNLALQAFYPLCFIGGALTIFYPDFLDSQMFWEIRTVTGLLHHTIMLWVVILCIATGYVDPTLKKWYLYPLAMTIVMTFGVFEKDAFKFGKAMQIGQPFISSLPILTSWYVIGIVSVLLNVLFLFIHDKRKERLGK